MARVLFIFGTRPEAIKLCPTVLYLKRETNIDVRVCVTAQHRGLLDQVLDAFQVTPDYDLDLMLPGQTLFQSTSRILTGLEPVLERDRPDLVLVQGDTTTTMAGALAAFYKRIPVGHIEAGLRTHDLYQPFPEEANRLLTGRLATLHFAATSWAAGNLLREGIPESAIHITGNTGIDAVLYIRDALEAGRLTGGDWSWVDPNRKLILVTAHRRESFGEGFERICEALALLAARPDVQIVYPVHPNPNVQDPVNRRLRSLSNVRLIEPVSYVPFVDLMRRAYILITDSGGIQEEGPSLGKPILVLRDKTERPEAVEAGTVKLVGADVQRIVGEAGRLLDDPKSHTSMSRVHNPYGDGRASERIAAVIRSFHSK
ncbi:MAG: UDP-N-acetylglucosamine 2-epimerase (non-hydrolyzing) [Acidobacteria bacterium]|nr:UDP-N-acetylglucosamine 2-epimerase (non-hydrolyzing) [Acidobacteriota bacterium]